MRERETEKQAREREFFIIPPSTINTVHAHFTTTCSTVLSGGGGGGKSSTDFAYVSISMGDATVLVTAGYERFRCTY